MDPDMYHLLAQYFPATQLQISKHKKQNIYTCDYTDLLRAKNFAFTRQKQKVEEGYMPFRGHQVYYRIVGERQEGKAPIILLHGGPGIPTTISRCWIKLPRLAIRSLCTTSWAVENRM